MASKLLNKLNKIVDDTLKESNGRWSRKSLTMFTAFAISILIGCYIVVYYEHSALEVFYGFVLMATGQSILAYKEKKNQIENNTQENERH